MFDNSVQVYKLSIPEEAMYGVLGDVARESDSPWTLAYPIALTFVAGQGINMTEDPNPRTCLYTLTVADKENGKSRTAQRIRTLLRYDYRHVTKATVSSDRGVFSLVRRDLDKKDKMERKESLVLYTDEMRQMLKKMNIENSGLTEQMNKLFDVDRDMVSDKSGTQDINVRMSFLGGITAKDPEEFREWFTHEMSGGFASRCSICPMPEFEWPWANLWEDKDTKHPNFYRRPQPAKWAFDDAEVEVVEPEPDAPELPFTPLREVKFPRALYAQVDEWKTAHKAAGVRVGRIEEIALRIAVISSAANQEPEVTPACLKAALTYADWQMEVRKVYAPSLARNEGAILYGIIVEKMEAAHQAEADGKPFLVGDRVVTDGPWVRFNELQKKFNLNKKYGADKVKTQIASMVSLKTLEELVIKGDRGESPKHTGKYRLLDFVPANNSQPSTPMPTAPASMEEA